MLKGTQYAVHRNTHEPPFPSYLFLSAPLVQSLVPQSPSIFLHLQDEGPSCLLNLSPAPNLVVVKDEVKGQLAGGLGEAGAQCTAHTWVYMCMVSEDAYSTPGRCLPSLRSCGSSEKGLGSFSLLPSAPSSLCFCLCPPWGNVCVFSNWSDELMATKPRSAL